MLHCYLFFHCNLAFSSIEEKQRATVIDRCYSPMLDLAERHGIPIGVEASGWTLEEIARLRPEWIERLKSLPASGGIEFIGSGYAQIIGPLVPAAVNAANQRLGRIAYERLLGSRPSLALVNEQAYSAGILEHYADNGYAGVIMEWDNPRLFHPQWPGEYRYAPQRVRDMRGRPLGLLWNQTVLFQHLQRVAHGELEAERYAAGLRRHDGDMPRALCLYGNDAEIFDFRPGRFETEAPPRDGEWKILADCLCALRLEKTFSFRLPSEIFSLPLPAAGNLLRPETAECPVPVKKQPKYNLLRWAVTGRDDFHINTQCHALARAFAEHGATDEEWRELCFLWGSDFRTHITAARWGQYRRRLARLAGRRLKNAGKNFTGARSLAGDENTPVIPVRENGKKDGLTLRTDTARVTLNPRKGLAIESAVFPAVSEMPLFGTLPHGFFDTISFAADFFTGHVVMEVPGLRRYTDLSETTPHVYEHPESVDAVASIPNFYCPLEKRVSLSRTEPTLRIGYAFSWRNIPAGSIRLLHLTLNPGAFDTASLFYAAHNGGEKTERHALRRPFNHGAPVSFMISASQAAGMTEGMLVLGDRDKELRITINPARAAVVGMLSHRVVGDSAYTRLVLSIREFDETVKPLKGARRQTILVGITGICNPPAQKVQYQWQRTSP
jgi:hypothetical protein